MSNLTQEDYVITEEDIEACWPNAAEFHLARILNGECTVDELREGLLSLIGSTWDIRTEIEGETDGD